MRLGFDVDGCLSDFCRAFTKLLIEITKRDTFHPFDHRGPATWDWFYPDGYTKAEVATAWAVVKERSDWWARLSPLEGARTLADCRGGLERDHDLYFITSRAMTPNAKAQTEQWLKRGIGLANPTVLISGEKGMCVAALKLDAYIDDNLPNVLDVVARRPLTKTFLLDKNYNPGPTPGVTRVRSVAQMLDYIFYNI